MRVLILGADGYLGWPTAMHFSARGHDVMALDNFAKRRIELEEGIEPLLPIPTLHSRVRLWREVTGREILLRVGDLLNHRLLYEVLEEFKPDAIVHYAEQPSAPYSMHGRPQAVYTQHNNVIGTLNLLFAMQKHCRDAHLIKLGTLGEYGTPNIDIEEGYITIHHNGRSDTLPFPKQPFSFYHLSKVHDSANILFACRVWGLRATDLNQGVVYGYDTDETLRHPDLRTSFHYDAVFGTVLNRFCTQAVAGEPLTVYGKGGQTRGCLNLRDTLQCVDLAAQHPAQSGECRVFNQFTESFSILQYAEFVRAAGSRRGLDVRVEHLANPRVEQEEHYYNPRHTRLLDLGLKPHLLTVEVVDRMIEHIQLAVAAGTARINHRTLLPEIRWRR
jgi:UDP-sulfoquinovose synthase